jgi:hypothetical protein
MKIDELAEFLSAEVKRYVAEGISALETRIDAKFAALPAPQKGEKGDDADMGALREAMTLEIRTAVAEHRDALHGSMREAIDKAIGDLPPAEPGRPGEPGRDADLGVMKETIRAEVDSAYDALKAVVLEAAHKSARDAVAAIPPPAPAEPGAPGPAGADADMDTVAALITEAVAAQVKQIPPAKDGLGIAETLITRSGDLVLTMTDGSTRNVGPVVGKDAEPGKQGDPGLDGLGFDDLNVAYDGERTITLVFERGDQVKAFPLVLPIVLERGVFKVGTAYQKGDGVTWGGSYWIAQEDTIQKPGEGNKGWRLAVRKGRDSREPIQIPGPPKPAAVVRLPGAPGIPEGA